MLHASLHIVLAGSGNRSQRISHTLACDVATLDIMAAVLTVL